MGSSARKKRGLFWFRRDLRTLDHPLLSLATSECFEMAFVYILDPRELAPHPQISVPKTGSHRRQFLLECLQDLDRHLQRRGFELNFIVADPAETVASLVNRYGFTDIYVTEDPGHDERAHVARVRETVPVPVHEMWLATLHSKIPSSMPPVFTDFRRAVEGQIPQDIPVFPEPTIWPQRILINEKQSWEDLAQPTLPSEPRSVLRFRGGETEGLARLEEYIWRADALKEYKETRNGMIGPNFSTKISPWLAQGCLSPRQVAREVRMYERTRVTNESTYWLLFELLWRDFFIFHMRVAGAKWFRFQGTARRPRDHRRGPFGEQVRQFQLWARAATGQPLVDAIVRELILTGFVSNRGRQIAASYLIYDLGVDWRWGAQFFESYLIDYDPAANYGNWAYIAGAGADPRPVRRFDPIRQAELYDPDGAYQELWRA